MSSLKTYIICDHENEETVLQALLRGIEKDDIIRVFPSPCDTSKIFNMYDPYLDRGVIPLFSSNILTLEEISMVMRYYTIFQQVAESSADDLSPILVLEPNVILHRDFLPNVRKIMEDEVWDCVRLMCSENNRSIPCTGAILFRTKFIRNAVKTFLPFRESIDSELYFQTVLHKANVLVCNPSIAYR